MTPAIAAAGGDIDTDPFGLFTECQQENVLPYNEEVFRVLCGERNGE
jgi:hypothetical protein